MASADKVPAHRFATPVLAEAIGSRRPSQPALVATIGEFTELGIDWADLLGEFLSNQGDTSYEQLDCLGLDINRELLVATLRIKLPSGFAGAPCSSGSVEYVSFWVDYDNSCQWAYLDTARLVVHDFNPLPADGLHYQLAVPADLDGHLGPGPGPRLGRIRAVLSWNAQPSTTDPYLLQRWGNAIEAHIEIPPRHPVSNDPEIRSLGRISVESIGADGLTTAAAKFLDIGAPADSLYRACPFGGVVVVHGYRNDAFVSVHYSYRVMWRPAGTSGPGSPVTDPFVIGDTAPLRYPDPTTGYTPYLSYGDNPMGQLAAWRTRGVVVDGLYELRLEMVDVAHNLIGTTAWYPIRVDNTPPVAELTLSSGTPCNKVAPGDSVQGTFVATDQYFGSYSLDTLPASLHPPAPTHVPSSTNAPVPAGGSWSLSTDGSWPQCGYVVQLWVSDRSILDSLPNAHNVGYDDKGFCLGL